MMGWNLKSQMDSPKVGWSRQVISGVEVAVIMDFKLCLFFPRLGPDYEYKNVINEPSHLRIGTPYSLLYVK